MKKVLWVLLALVVLAVAGGAIFIATFDIDKYRPLLVKKAEEALGKKVTLGRLSLGWRSGIAIEARDFAIYPGVSANEKPSATLESAAVVVRLMPLLNKDVQIASIVLIKPRVHLGKWQDGSFTVAGIKPSQPAQDASPAQPGTTASPAKSGADSLLLSIDSMKVRDGEVYFHDLSGPKPVHINILDVDADIKNFSFTEPLAFDVRAALFSQNQNVALKGELDTPLGDSAGTLQNLLFRTDLGRLEWAEVVKAFPDLKSAGVREGLAGDLEVSVERLSFDPREMKSTAANARLRDGMISLRQFQTPFERINADISIKGDRAEIRDISSNFAAGAIKISGTIDHPMGQALSTIRASFRDLALQALIPPAKPRSPQLSGRLSVDFEGRAAGIQWPQISQSLSGQGRLNLRDGFILNYNILREVVQKISAIPGVGDALQANFPQEYSAKLGEPNTVLQPVESAFTINGGRIIFNDLLLMTDAFAIRGAGAVGFDKRIDVQAMLWVSPHLSAALVRAAPQMQMLEAAQGQLGIPLAMKGVLPSIIIVPDMQYLMSKIAASKAQELVSGLLTKSSGTAGTAPAQGGTAQSPLADLLGKALKGRES